MEDQLARGSNWDEFKPVRQILLVTNDIFPAVWPQVEPIFLVDRAGWGEYYTLDSIRDFIIEGMFQLWVMNDEDEFLLVALTQLLTFPKTKVICTIWVGGTNLRDGLKLWDYMELWANKQGATKSIGFVKRKGLLRLLRPHGYKQVALAFEKDISGIREH